MLRGAQVAFQPGRFPRLDRVGVEHLHQVARQAAQVVGVVGVGEPHHQLFGLPQLVGVEIGGQPVQHLRDRLGLFGQHAPFGCGGCDGREPGQSLPLDHQPARRTTRHAGSVGQPGDGGGAMLGHRHPGLFHLGG